MEAVSFVCHTRRVCAATRKEEVRIQEDAVGGCSVSVGKRPRGRGGEEAGVGEAFLEV